MERTPARSELKMENGPKYLIQSPGEPLTLLSKTCKPRVAFLYGTTVGAVAHGAAALALYVLLKRKKMALILVSLKTTKRLISALSVATLL